MKGRLVGLCQFLEFLLSEIGELAHPHLVGGVWLHGLVVLDVGVVDGLSSLLLSQSIVGFVKIG